MVFQYIWRCFSPAGYFDTFHYRKKKQVPTSDSMTRNYRYRVTHIPGCWRHQEIVQQQIGGGTLFRPGNFGMMLGFCGGKSDSKKNIKRYTVPCFFFTPVDVSNIRHRSPLVSVAQGATIHPKTVPRLLSLRYAVLCQNGPRLEKKKVVTT